MKLLKLTVKNLGEIKDVAVECVIPSFRKNASEKKAPKWTTRLAIFGPDGMYQPTIIKMFELVRGVVLCVYSKDSLGNPTHLPILPYKFKFELVCKIGKQVYSISFNNRLEGSQKMSVKILYIKGGDRLVSDKTRRKVLDTVGKGLLIISPRYSLDVECNKILMNCKDDYILKLQKLFQDADLDITDIRNLTVRNEYDKWENVEVLRKTSDYDEFDWIPFRDLSEGTQYIIKMWIVMRYAIDYEKVLVAENFGNNLHPLLLKDILNIYTDTPDAPCNAEYNPDSWSPLGNLTRSQIIFTTHQVYLLDPLCEMKTYEIGMVDRNHHGILLHYMSDFKGGYKVSYGERRVHVEGILVR